jgi:hypothetical protein
VSWVEIIKNVLALAVLITQMIKDSQQRGLGRMEATNEALQNAQRDIAYASAVEEDAIRSHCANPDSDDGFDKEFMRPD